MRHIKRSLYMLVLIIIYSFLLTGCDEQAKLEAQRTNTKINVQVWSVDNGIIHGKITCEYGDSYAIYRDGNIEYYKNDGADAVLIPCPGMKYMNMNNEYIYYTRGTGLQAVNLKDLSDECVDRLLDVQGINVYDDEVILVGYFEDNDTYEQYYRVEGTSKELIGGFDQYLRYKSPNGHSANMYSYERETYISVLSKEWRLDDVGYLKTGENASKVNRYDCMTNCEVLSPEHVAIYEDMVYLLLQRSSIIQGCHNNVLYRWKEWDELISFDPVTTEAVSIIKTSGPEIQIVNFSIENDELYTLEEGVLYKSTLAGENKTELESFVGRDTLAFEYVNDSLLVIKDGQIIGIY